MMDRIQRHTISFSHAFAGITAAARTQPNFQVHCLIAAAVILAGIYFKINPTEWAVVTLTIVWVLLSEMINTAIESMVDLITFEYREQAKIAKDVAAGAVLLGAIGSIAVGLIIFLPHIIN
jgi:diacylglycerol kinase